MCFHRQDVHTADCISPRWARNRSNHKPTWCRSTSKETNHPKVHTHMEVEPFQLMLISGTIYPSMSPQHRVFRSHLMTHPIPLACTVTAWTLTAHNITYVLTYLTIQSTKTPIYSAVTIITFVWLRKSMIQTSSWWETAVSCTSVNKPRASEDDAETTPVENSLHGRSQLSNLHGSKCPNNCSVSITATGLCWTWLSVGQTTDGNASMSGTTIDVICRFSSSGTPLVRNARLTSNACFSASVRTGSDFLLDCFVRLSNIGANLPCTTQKQRNFQVLNSQFLQRYSVLGY